MKNTEWELAETLPQYVQMDLFPPTFEEKICIKMSDLEKKQDRQRRALFGEVGKMRKHNDERYNEVKGQCQELMERLAIIERGLCLEKESECEILQLLQN
jgi:hypothetical protein